MNILLQSVLKTLGRMSALLLPNGNKVSCLVDQANNQLCLAYSNILADCEYTSD